ncbi:Phage integrase family protein [Tenacibaculum maritimum]|uniref:site-specific integrase n=1 Tax=Tenacibaculum maritimum TaxID=107401 RepID=UPI0012E5AC7E|nr:site-specific integrase [Tenacibaculum maritimum]CAA0229122.1 Phage integrase family protein [Tenacibaculum maritimum]
MQVTFSLRKEKVDKNGLMPVLMTISFNSIRIRKTVKGVKSLPKHWKTREQRVKPSLKNDVYNYHIEYNKVIDEKEDEIKKLFRYTLLNNINPTKDYFLEKLENGLNKLNLTHEFFPSFEEFKDSCKSTKTPRTIKSYVTTINFLKDFESFSRTKLLFDSIDSTFFEKLQDYTFTERKNKNSYFAFIIKILKTFMNWSLDKEYHNNLKYKKFKAKEDETEIIYLTMEELMTLYNHDFESDRLNQVRDMYVFNSVTGLRISDYKTLKQSNIKKDYLLITIQKTKAINTKIPLNKFSREILERYKDTIHEPLPVISDQKFNKYIKECCEIVEINSLVTKTRYIGQKKVEITVPKHKLITSHTARKTFVTNSLILGMKEMVVRNITGHKKEENFRRYVKIAEDFKRQEMDNTWDKV